MGSSSASGPFCILKNATCCSETFCEPSETCCGNYCCRSVRFNLFPSSTSQSLSIYFLTYDPHNQGTTCSTDPKNPGCCPHGQSCSSHGSATCVEHFSRDCSGTISPSKQCCPSNLPFCYSMEGKGYGCYAANTVSSTSIVSSTTIQLPEQTSGDHHRGTTTLVETVSVKIISESSGSSGLSLQFPETVSLRTDLTGWEVETMYVFSFPSSIFGAPKTTVIATSSSSTSSPSGPTSHSHPFGSTSTSTTTSSSTPSTSQSPKSTTSTTHSPLCFDPLLQTPAPCPPSTSSTSPSTSAYPTELVIHSAAHRLAPSKYIVILILVVFLGAGVAFLPIESIAEWVVLPALSVAFSIWRVESEAEEHMEEKRVKDNKTESASGKGNGGKSMRDGFLGQVRWYIS